MEVVKPERFFHERFGLSDRALERVLGTALGRRADWADLYFEFRVNQTASLDLYPVARPPVDTPTADQVALLQQLDAVARATDPCITNVFAGIAIEHRVVLVVTSAGAVVGDVRPLVHLSVTCIAERGGRREQGSYGGGGRYAFDTLLDGR